MYEDENNLYHYSYRKGDEQIRIPAAARRKRAAAVFPARSWRWRWCARSSAASSAQA